MNVVVVFVGAMGSGKSTIGARVATALGAPFLDNDALLEQHTGHTAADLAATDGIDALHRAEAEVLLAALRAPGPAVIAAAASTITAAEVRDALRVATVVWLRAAPDVLAGRLPESPTRPFAGADPARLVRTQSERRDNLFAEAADIVVETDKSDINAVVARVLDLLRES